MTKRNTGKPTRSQTQRWGTAMSGLARVRERAGQDKQQPFTALMHHLTLELLEQSFYELKRKAATGIDGVCWSDYHENLQDRLTDLVARIQAGQYKPKPARQVSIPKGNGENRILSIQCIEDKLLQQAVVTLLNQIYEPELLGFSYGFRPGRSQHDALDALSYGISKKKVNWVLDLDIRRFFDTVEHDWLIRMVQHRVQDKRLIKLIYPLDQGGRSR